MPDIEKPEPTDFRLANFRDVDASNDAESFVQFLDGFHKDFAHLIEAGLDLLNLHQGSSVLDVGCGHGVVLPTLATLVGPSGSVAGIDLSSTLVAEATRRLEDKELPVSVQVGNAQHLDFQDSTFDAVRADRVLVFLSNPQAALKEMVRVTKPGGRVVVTEIDLGASMLDSIDTDTTTTVLRRVSQQFPSGWIGRQLRALFFLERLRDIAIQFFTIPNTSFSTWSRRFAIEDAVSAAVTSNDLSASRAEQWLAELRHRDSRGLFLATSTLCMVSGTRALETLAQRGRAMKSG